MEEYFINNDTLMLKPISEAETLVIEYDKRFLVEKNIMDIVKESCCYFGSSYEGRYQGSKNLLKMSYKLPIIIEDSHELVIFPTCSSRQENCCWISLNNIEDYKKINGKTIIQFKDDCCKESVDISYSSFENQIFRSTMLLTKLKKRKKI